MYSEINLKAGDTKVVQITVSLEDTALNYGSGQLEHLFATPKLVALMIEASVKLIDPKLPDELISIGKHVEVDHLAPTALSQIVTLEVKITSLALPIIQLEMKAYDEIGLIGTGRHSRYIVNKRNLLEKAYARIEP